MSDERVVADTLPIAHRYEHDREHDWAALERFADLATRSGLTVSADGVSQVQTLPTLIATGGPFFGREMSEPEILAKRPVPAGTVEVGVPTVVEPIRK